MLTLIPLVMPGMLIGIFFSAMLINLNIDNAFISIVIGHTVLTLPYSIRIMSAGFKSVPQDLDRRQPRPGLRRVGHLLQCLSAAVKTELPRRR